MIDYVIVILYCLCIFINGMNAGLDFKNGRTGIGIMYCVCAVLWTACVCMKMI